MLSSSLLPSEAYNRLPGVNTNTAPPLDDLHAIGPLFIEHNMHLTYGIALLHKHFNVADNEAMVHDGLVCEPVSSLPADVTPRSFYMHEGKFQAYEYETHGASAALPETAFLDAFSHYLVEHKLDKTIALTRVSSDPWAPVLVERMGDGRSHICTPAEKGVVNGHKVDLLGDEEMVDTEWRFRPCCCGGVKAKVVKKCVQVKDPPGGHMDC